LKRPVLVEKDAEADPEKVMALLLLNELKKIKAGV
jgi:hypothetical protein